MTRPDLDAIRKCLLDPSLSASAFNSIILILEHSEELENRTTYTVGETEWAHRIAVAEQRFVDEYDARRAAEREIVELKARITTLEAMKP